MEKFSSFAFCLLFVVVFGLCHGQLCSKYCICSLERTECFFDYADNGLCLGVVPLSETYVINIHGPVCAENRKLLKSSVFANTIKVFNDDICGDVPNCR